MKRKLLSILLACILALGIAIPALPVLAAETETLRPDGDGDVTDMPIPDSGDHWIKVDEVEADEDSTFVGTDGDDWAKYDLYTLADSVGVGTVSSVKVYIRCRRNSVLYDGVCRIKLKTGGTLYDNGDDLTLADNWTTFSYQWDNNPGGGAWTWVQVDALQVGVYLSPKYARCTQVYAEVNYTVTAPDITTNAATYVAKTTAQLNATVTDDGGQACDVRFGYGDETQAVFANYDTITDWVEDTYTTGQHPFVEIDSLVADTEYFFRVQIKNDHSTVDPDDELTFTTEAAIATPTNLKAFPASTTIGLTWTKGVGATETMIRYSEVTYPADETEGTHAYTGTLGSYTITGLTAGHTYYIVAIGKTGAEYTATVEVMATTGAAEDAAYIIDIPDTPSELHQVTDPTQISNFPGYAMFNDIATDLNIPLNTMWIFIMMMGIIFVSYLVYKLSHTLLPVIIVALVGISFTSIIGILPMWIMYICIFLGLGLLTIQARRAA